MTGEEHYLEAERDISTADDQPIGNGSAGYFIARAQVHATLAQAAAAAELADATRRATRAAAL